MPPSRRDARPALLLLVIAAAAALLRLMRLGAKPLWLDEAMTILVSFGRGAADVPIGRALSVASLRQIFSPAGGSSVVTVLARLRDPLVQHTHPPLFYVLLRGWLAIVRPDYASLAAAARLLPALLGVASVLVAYLVARAATTDRGALIAAALTALSPLMVMIAREARNYTLPLVCVGAATWSVATIADAIASRRPPPLSTWIVFTVANIAGCYAHYFVIVSCAAEAAVIGWIASRARATGALIALSVCAAAIAIAYAPWIPTFLVHSRSPEQAWMRESNPLVYVYDTLSAWQAIVQGWKFDIDSPQGAWKAIRIAIGVPILAYVGYAVVRVLRGADATPALRAVAATAALTIVALLIACAFERKDLVGEYRYHFVYFPALATVVGAALDRRRAWFTAALLALACIHSAFFVAGWEFPQLTRPTEVGGVLARGTDAPALVAVGEMSFHETVTATTFVLAFDRAAPAAAASTTVVFVRRGDSYPTFQWRDVDPATFWSRLDGLAVDRVPPIAWVWSVSMLPGDYQRTFRLTAGDRLVACTIDSRDLDRTIDDEDSPRGPFRRYRCL